MKNNEINNLYQQNQQTNFTQNQILNNLSNSNEPKGNVPQNNGDLDDNDDVDDNLKYTEFTNNNTGSFFQQGLDSMNTQSFKYKFSIDQPNVSKQRLNEFLNNDLLNALDVSPSISKLNSGLNDNNQNINQAGDNNPKNLYGFSLYSQPNNQNINNQNNFQSLNNNTNFSNQNNINNNYPNNLNNNNYYPNINNNYISLNYNSKAYIPLKFRKNEQNNQTSNVNNTKTTKNNKFDNGKKNKHKSKKNFEMRDGDWKCCNCNNLNFSFRNKCNRCSLPKEYSINMALSNPNMYNQNQNQQF